MDLSIIIVSWNVRELLKKCLGSVFEYTSGIEYEVIVVDNASVDGSADMVAKEFSRVKLIVNNKNLGFARANNQGIKKANGRYILILNDDTEIFDNAFERLIQMMDDNKEYGIAGCKLLNKDKSLQKSVRRFPGLLDQLLILLKLHHLPWLKKNLDKYLAVDFDYSKEQEAEQIMGAFMLTRWEILDKIGLFDENFYCWFEEVDWCRRANEVGVKVMYTPEAEVIHVGGESFKQWNWHKQLIWNHSLHHYFWKHEAKWKWLILWLVQPISILLAMLIQIIKTPYSRLTGQALNHENIKTNK